MSLTLQSYIDQVVAGTLNPETVISDYLEKAKALNKDNNAFITFSDEYVKNNMHSLIQGEFKGAPIAVKDLILTKGVRTTFASKIAEDFIAPYSATCFTNIEKAGACMIGKANLDEFAMGSGNENSAFGPVVNPYGNMRISGGTSGGSAAAVAADMCIAALGTDTGGSVRQPAFMCGVVGLKPTYGRVSRYGVQGMASSFDTVGVLTKTVYDSALMLKAIAGHDIHDATSVQRDDTKGWFDTLQNSELKGKKIGYFKEFFEEGIDPDIAKNTQDVLEWAKLQGAEIIPLNFPLLKYMVAVYYILCPAEVSTNLSRFDGLRYGLQDDTSAFASIKDYYATIRDRGFGKEAKRRILLGSYVLSAGFYDAYYRKAQQVRRKMQDNLANVYKDVDVILGPTSPELAWKIGERVNDPMKNYLADIYTIPANIGGYPAISIPTGFIHRDGEDFAVGVQLMANHWREDLLFGIGKDIEKYGKQNID